MDSLKDLLDYEASIVQDWPKDLQDLVDKKIIKVEYDKNENPIFSLTELGRSVLREIDLKFN
jgi:hypothetical protein